MRINSKRLNITLKKKMQENSINIFILCLTWQEVCAILSKHVMCTCVITKQSIHSHLAVIKLASVHDSSFLRNSYIIRYVRDLSVCRENVGM